MKDKKGAYSEVPELIREIQVDYASEMAHTKLRMYLLRVKEIKVSVKVKIDKLFSKKAHLMTVDEIFDNMFTWLEFSVLDVFQQSLLLELGGFHIVLEERSQLEELASLSQEKNHRIMVSCPTPNDDDLKILSTFLGLTGLILKDSQHITSRGFILISFLQNLRVLKLYNCKNLTDDDVQLFKSQKYLEQLLFTFSPFISGAVLSSIKKSNTLRSLNISYCDQFGPDGLENLPPNLTHLVLDRCGHINNTSLSFIKNLSELKHLSLEQCLNLDEVGMIYVGLLKNLEHLNLDQCAMINNNGFQEILKLKALRYLSLNNAYLITSNFFPFIEALENLEYLNLTFTHLVNSSTVHVLKKLKYLKTLKLSSREIDDQVVEKLAEIKTLKELSLNLCTSITNYSVEHLKKLPKLELLNLSSCDGIGVDLFRNPKGFKNLLALSVSRNRRFNNQSLEDISQLTNLKTLDISFCPQVNNSGFYAVLQLENLEYLYAEACNGIVDFGLECLQLPPKLRVLDLRNCENIPDETKQILREKYPLTRIL